jgi:hypothetical protein
MLRIKTVRNNLATGTLQRRANVNDFGFQYRMHQQVTRHLPSACEVISETAESEIAEEKQHHHTCAMCRITAGPTKPLAQQQEPVQRILCSSSQLQSAHLSGRAQTGGMTHGKPHTPTHKHTHQTSQPTCKVALLLDWLLGCTSYKGFGSATNQGISSNEAVAAAATRQLLSSTAQQGPCWSAPTATKQASWEASQMWSVFCRTRSTQP